MASGAPADSAKVFGLLQIVWFVWLGIVMLRTASRHVVPVAPAERVDVAPRY
jgi:hypothetical protein